MAIKGKKKKGKAGPRRPAGAPRTIQRAPQRAAWHQRTGIRIGLGVALVASVVLIPVLVGSSGDDDAGLERRQRAIESFTGDTEVLLQKLSPTAAEMLASTAQSKSLAADAKRWDRNLTEVQQEMASTVAAAPPELDAANRLVFQSVLQYIAAAKTYALIPDATGVLRSKIAERAAAQVAAADGTWSSGVTVLDQERLDAELAASGLRAPSEVVPAPTPTGG